MDKNVKRGEYLKEVMSDPTKAVNIEEDIIDENLDILLISNEDHANYEISFKKRELQKIRNKTVDMLNKLKNKSDVERKTQMNALKRQQAGNFAKCLVGDKVEYIVEQYITILKRKVLERQEDTMKKKNEDIVDAIVKKQNFNLTFKESNKAAKKSKPR